MRLDVLCAGRVAELRTAGKSLRETAREAGLSLGQVEPSWRGQPKHL
ncbi:MAG: hypothetical protein WCJ64_05295 [Rhodospirillaceae bacterium]